MSDSSSCTEQRAGMNRQQWHCCIMCHHGAGQLIVMIYTFCNGTPHIKLHLLLSSTARSSVRKLFTPICWEETPRRGGRQQPHQTLKKSKKYKGSKKRHTMVTQSSPKMPKWHHSTLKAWSILAWILSSRVDQRKLMAFQVAIPISTVVTQACWRIFLEEY